MNEMLVGEYIANCNRHGILVVPQKWLEEGLTELYCLTCWDDGMECFYLRFFSNKKEMREKLEEAMKSGQEEIKIVRRSIHRLIPNTKCIVLPKIFVEQRKKKAEKDWICEGVIDFFEVWYAEDFEKLSEGIAQLLNILDI